MKRPRNSFRKFDIRLKGNALDTHRWLVETIKSDTRDHNTTMWAAYYIYRQAELKNKDFEAIVKECGDLGLKYTVWELIRQNSEANIKEWVSFLVSSLSSSGITRLASNKIAQSMLLMMQVTGKPIKKNKEFNSDVFEDLIKCTSLYIFGQIPEHSRVSLSRKNRRRCQ